MDAANDRTTRLGGTTPPGDVTVPPVESTGAANADAPAETVKDLDVETTEPAMSATEAEPYLSELREAGKTAPRELLDRVKALGDPIVPHLIAMATDRALHEADGDSPHVWAPLHAIKLLGELQAVEAVRPLLPLLTWDDDDDVPDAVVEAFAEMGEPLFEMLNAILTADVFSRWSRGRAAEALGKMAKRYPDLRRDVIAVFEARLALGQASGDDDYLVNGFVVSQLVGLHAIETLPQIAHAFADGIVDETMVTPEDVLLDWGPLLDPADVDQFRFVTDSIVPPSELLLPPPVASPPLAASPVLPRTQTKVGRNDPCPCGSGKKYKKCCGK